MQITFYFILEDLIVYWGHRFLHTKWLYKHVHSIHHEYVERLKYSPGHNFFTIYIYKVLLCCTYGF
jgi:sterol desaturase/sphingolipid hydroxylase (fatty acid hydroxylase superfamily)